ncbi:Homeodomain-like protein [Pochonia chlamydosporia 170]|uniref:Homeodomain-like protein n=1 Tax=Pochonia chlamydosporia 170 TaxID=1380566 RepID=A0A179FCJ0_METCM|nr:Homeodomain-like protein [Pochonia chlamydosporia 170]OAQ63202.1 Homeodomain-like protein [Pochonia chlamydosporia 170]
MDSDEEYAVDEQSVAEHESDFAYTELDEVQGVYSTVNQSDRESSYLPSDQSIDLRTRQALSQDEREGSRSPLKRPAKQARVHRPFKRQKGILNTEYIDLLNRDIDDAAHRVCLDETVDLPGSQLGLTTWSAVEKQQFFESLSRLGRYDLPGIAARIGTKSEIEVKQYIHLLHTTQERRADFNRRSYLESAEYPAAVEISQQCCHAQEEVADAISVRQERSEQQREAKKWGGNWDITPSIARRLTRRGEEGVSTSESTLRFAQLFHLSNWLKLSERVFMNSSIPGSNWNNIDDRHPSMWATALDDFHSLAVSVTRRLVQSTLFISMSRIRAKKELIPTTREIVRAKDVEAAVASLGMMHNSNNLWIKAARRLRLDVYEEPPDRDDEDIEEEPMDYEEVEAALSGDTNADESRSPQGRILKIEGLSGDDLDDDDEEDNYDTGVDSEGGFKQEIDEEEDEITHEANEILWYSAPELKDIQAAKEALKLRITMERKQEAEAALHDEYASYQAEMEMWNILQKRPPMEPPKVQDPGRVHRSNVGVEDVYPLGRNWATKLEYYGEWETLDTEKQKE